MTSKYLAWKKLNNTLISWFIHPPSDSLIISILLGILYRKKGSNAGKILKDKADELEDALKLTMEKYNVEMLRDWIWSLNFVLRSLKLRIAITEVFRWEDANDEESNPLNMLFTVIGDQTIQFTRFSLPAS